MPNVNEATRNICTSITRVRYVRKIECSNNEQSNYYIIILHVGTRIIYEYVTRKPAHRELANFVQFEIYFGDFFSAAAFYIPVVCYVSVIAYHGAIKIGSYVGKADFQLVFVLSNFPKSYPVSGIR